MWSSSVAATIKKMGVESQVTLANEVAKINRPDPSVVPFANPDNSNFTTSSGNAPLKQFELPEAGLKNLTNL